MDTTTPSRPGLEDGGEHAEDRQAIEQVIADGETGYNTKDPELSVAHFAADARATTAQGAQAMGWDTLLEAHRTGYAGPLRDQFARYRVDDIAFVRPDVALVHKHAHATDAQGEQMEVDHAMVALYVMVKQDGRWWIAARANTLVVR